MTNAATAHRHSSRYPTEIRRTYTTTRHDADESLLVSTEEDSSSVISEPDSSEESHAGTVVQSTRSSEIGRPGTTPAAERASQEPKSQEIISLGGLKLGEAEDSLRAFIDLLKTNKNPKKTKRDLLEDFIRSNSSKEFMKQMSVVADKEIKRLKNDLAKKWGSTAVAGSTAQLTSFGVSAEIALATQMPWLFPVIASFLNEIISDKAGALIRNTTYTTNDTKNLLRKQRLIARAIGDIIRQSFGLKPEAKYRTNNPEFKGKKFTAWQALMHDTDSFFIISTHNMINRGLPFLSFTGTYLVRDAVLKYALKGAPGWALMLVRIGAGAIAGGSTALFNQLITSANKDAVENPGHSTSYWRAKEDYLHQIQLDIRDRLNEAESIKDPELKDNVTRLLFDLNKKIKRESEVAKLRGSKLTALAGEVRASFHKHREEDSLDPEAPGTRSETMFNILGKFASLVYFTYMFNEAMKSPSGTESFSPYSILNFAMLPVALILMGFMWRDDLRLIPRTGYAAGKAIRDGTVGRAQYQQKTAPALTDVVTSVPGSVQDKEKIDTRRNQSSQQSDARKANAARSLLEAEEASDDEQTKEYRQSEASDQSSDRITGSSSSSDTSDTPDPTDSSGSSSSTSASESDDQPLQRRRKH